MVNRQKTGWDLWTTNGSIQTTNEKKNIKMLRWSYMEKNVNTEFVDEISFN